jgi:methionyl-tRNA formyltransferase
VSATANDIAVLARTRWGIRAAQRLAQAGRTIALVATSESETFYNCQVSDYAEFATSIGARFIDCSGGAQNLHQTLAESSCSIAISVNWPRVFDDKIIKVFPLGIINAHAGDLPRYRGNACPNWAILNDESCIGLCAHLMEADAVDSGPVILREHFPLTTSTYITEVYVWLDQRVPVILASAAEQLLQGGVPKPQLVDPQLGLRCYPRRPEDGRIDWRKASISVHRLIRASSRPFAGAFSFLENEKRVTIWRASMYSHPEPFCAMPGQVMLRVAESVVVACGEGCLLLEEVEVEGLSQKDSSRILQRSLRARFT